MTSWPQLAIDTLRDPKRTAHQIMGWNLDRGTLYMALFAVAAVNTLLASTPVVLSPGGVDAAARAALPLLALLERPMMFFAIVAGTLVIMIQALFWAGRAMGGEGEMTEMMALVIWLQALRAAAQAMILAVGFVAPLLAGLVALGLQLVAFWLFLHFISAAMRFDSLLRAFGLLIAVATGLFIGLMMILSLTGFSAGGFGSV
ncbi:YIP1 family protein [uncultured Tateyamaria sp.]|uniref:YIP1 family protein n=1 Tax=uncultured Tateyamaria sp. TaxID=455651 RepID=UPI00262F8AD9|nr:YIP1 family protein [uncultured Tateyamaria sp.]